MIKGKLVAIEGIDGSGKNTQAVAISEYLKKINIENVKIHFPLYSETFFGKEIGCYLNGKFGSLESVHPKLSSILYAGDRFEKKQFIEDNLNVGKIIICDRYVPSNIAHNSVKLPVEDQEKFESWIEELEYKVFCIPKPDLIIFLDVNPILAKENVLKKKIREYTDKKQDLHEENQDYMESVYGKFKQLAHTNNWSQISCSNDFSIKSANAITQEILSIILNKFF